jgi:hypothetical protein|tara:strand:+ start:900 stop:1187 length:288 start_codon:yes stop_codon:yes gene_type:complete
MELKKDEAVRSLYANVVVIDGEVCYDASRNVVTIDETAVTNKLNTEAYKDERKLEYPELAEQLDLLYKDMLADKGDKTGDWFAAVKKVKDDNPKP